MKMTEFVAMVSDDGVVRSKWRRVFIDEDGKLYIKVRGEKVCITGTPAEKMMVKD